MFESFWDNHLSVSLVERLKAEVCKTSRANCPLVGSNPTRHSIFDFIGESPSWLRHKSNTLAFRRFKSALSNHFP